MLTFTFLVWSLISFSQQNSLDFDGNNDAVFGTNGSNLIAGANGMSISFWVYPANNTVSKPYGQGIVGFSGNINIAEFHVRRLSSDSIRARFRNSTGSYYDIEIQLLTVNQWQHFTLTYDNLYLRIYKNGFISDSTLATGNIYDTIHSFFIGNLPYGLNNAFFKGKIDEVTLWSKALSGSEVLCLYKYGVDSAKTNLEIYYDFNQGIAGGNNTSINTLIDLRGNVNGQLSFFSRTGSSSNFVQGISTYTYDTINSCLGDSILFNTSYLDSSGSFWSRFNIVNGCDSFVFLETIFHSFDTVLSNESICQGDLFFFNGSYLSQKGTYYFTTQNRYGCDSTSVLNLEIDSIDTQVIQNRETLTVAHPINRFTWYCCDNDSIMSNDTLVIFIIPDDRSYAVIIYDSLCTDTSMCFQYDYTNILETNKNNGVEIFPNPSNGKIVLQGLSGFFYYELYTLQGVKVYQKSQMSSEPEITLSHNIHDGIYILKVYGDNQISIKKIILKRD